MSALMKNLYRFLIIYYQFIIVKNMNQKTAKRLRKATKLAREIIAGEKSGENKRSLKTLFNRVKKHYLALNSRQRADFKNRRV